MAYDEVYTKERKATMLEGNINRIITKTIEYEGIFEDDFETFVANDYHRWTEEPFENIYAAMESWKKRHPEKVIAARKRERPTH